jgi:hypothetical protein
MNSEGVMDQGKCWLGLHRWELSQYCQARDHHHDDATTDFTRTLASFWMQHKFSYYLKDARRPLLDH